MQRGKMSAWPTAASSCQHQDEDVLLDVVCMVDEAVETRSPSVVLTAHVCFPRVPLSSLNLCQTNLFCPKMRQPLGRKCKGLHPAFSSGGKLPRNTDPQQEQPQQAEGF